MSRPSVCYLTADRVLGVDLWRVFGPAQRLAAMGHPVAVVPLGRDIVDADVLVCSQRASRRPGAFAHAKRWIARHHPRGRMLVVLDACDDPTATDGFVGERRHAVRGDTGHTAAELHQDAIRSADLVTVNTEAMARVVRPLNPHVAVVPDRIDGTRWSPPAFVRPPRAWSDPVVVGVAGGESHHEDWKILADAWPVVAERYPAVRFVTLGYSPDYLKAALGDRLEAVPWQPIDRYQWAYGMLDVGCAPLDPALAFNRSKSPLKWYEYSLAGAATVASPLVYGDAVADGRTGVIARSVGGWVRAIETLVLDRRLRTQLVDAARREVIRHHSLSDAFLTGVLDTYRDHYVRVFGAEPGASEAA